MIITIIGLPGSGKSCYGAKISRKAFKKGITCYSNYEVDDCVIYDVTDIGRYMICDGWLMLDEAGIDISNRDFMDKSNRSTDKAARRWWKKYRHNGIDRVYIFSQAYDFDKTLRNLTDKMYIIKNTIFPSMSILKPLKATWDVDDEGQPCVKWKILPLVFIPFYRKPYYKYYNSFERDLLPGKEFPIAHAIYDRRSVKHQLYDVLQLLFEGYYTYIEAPLSF